MLRIKWEKLHCYLPLKKDHDRYHRSKCTVLLYNAKPFGVLLQNFVKIT